MEWGEPLYKSEYVEMASENKVNHQSVPRGSQNIVLNGKTIRSSYWLLCSHWRNCVAGCWCVLKGS
uniref:Uncharacterized protein n=1 Tax=Capra hircus TaxID=9925 RepID=A0A8C2QS38_CAPHI